MKRTSRTWRGGLVGLAAILGLSVVAMAAGPDGSKTKTAKGKDASASRSSAVDDMLQDGWKAAKVKSSRAATDEEFLRRAYLDLLGRIPNVQEATAFLENKDKGKRIKLVDYLLAHPDFAKNFANEWRIVLVGRKPQGRDVDSGALASWLRKEIVAERPWNEMAYELITAKGNNKENGAVNYPMSHMEDGAINLTSFTTRVFLGQQIQCTQCHDHPSNNWKQSDFWGINAFFKGLRSERVMKTDAAGAEVYDHTEVRDDPVADAHSRFERRNAVVGVAYPTYLDGTKLGLATAGAAEDDDPGRRLLEANVRLAQAGGTKTNPTADVNLRESLGKLITEKDKKQLARAFVNRTWGHFMGRGFVQPVDDFGDHNKPSHPELLERLADDFIASKFNIKGLIRTIMASEAYNVSSATTKENEKDETLFSHMALKPLTPEQLFDSLITATSAHRTAGEGSDKLRNQWLGQFTVTFANDEEGENSNFQGTIPQALMMMNGELMAKATGGGKGSFLADVVEKSQATRNPPRFVVDRLYLAALSRHPTNPELTNAAAFLNANPDSIQVVEDLFWSLLNSNEFVLNH